MYRGCDDVINCSGRFRFGLSRLNLRLEDSSSRVLGHKLERMKNRLSPSRSSGFGKYRSDHIDELGEASGFNSIRVVQQRDEGASHHQGILQIVDFFDQPWRDGPSGLALVLVGPRFVPDIPFIERKHHSLRRAPLRRYRIADRNSLFDKTIHDFDVCEEFPDVAMRILVIHMEREEIDLFKGMLHHLIFPRTERWHVSMRRAASGKLN